MEEDNIPYEFLHLQPHLAATTMYLHYQTIFNNERRQLNVILEAHPHLKGLSLEQLYFGPTPKTSERTKWLISNYSASVYNHDLFFSNITTPYKVRRPIGRLAEEINNTYGSFENFERIFTEAAKSAIIPGWLFLCTGENGDLHLSIVESNRIPNLEFITPIAVIDLFEHSYFMQYTINIGEYVHGWFQVLDFENIEKLFEAALR